MDDRNRKLAGALLVPMLVAGLAGGVVAVEGTWGEPERLGPEINSPFLEWGPCYLPSTGELFLGTDRNAPGQRNDLFVAWWEDADGAFIDPEPLEGLNGVEPHELVGAHVLFEHPVVTERECGWRRRVSRRPLLQGPGQ